MIIEWHQGAVAIEFNDDDPGIVTVVLHDKVLPTLRDRKLAAVRGNGINL